MLLTVLWSGQTNLLRSSQVEYCCLLNANAWLRNHTGILSLYPSTCRLTSTYLAVACKAYSPFICWWFNIHAYTCVIEFAAGPSTPTCRNCTGRNCENNFLPDLLQQRLLTSGYFNFFSSAKPAGKEPSAFCSALLLVFCQKHNNFLTGSKGNVATVDHLTRRANRTQWVASVRTTLGPVMAHFTTKQQIWLWMPPWSCWRISD